MKLAGSVNLVYFAFDIPPEKSGGSVEASARFRWVVLVPSIPPEKSGGSVEAKCSLHGHP